MNQKEEQFNKGVKEMQGLRLSSDARLRIKSNLDRHIATYSPKKTPSPYLVYFHYSYKMAFASLAVVLSISLGTAYASQSSLPGDILYPVKTVITEPAIKLTKQSKKAKEEFDLKLADTRIEEVEKLIQENKLTEEKLDANLALFEKHLAQREKDENKEESQKAKVSKTEEASLMLSQEVTLLSLEETDPTDARINKYRDVILSKPDLNNFYETKAKVKLEKRRKKPVIEETKENSALTESKEDFPAKDPTENIDVKDEPTDEKDIEDKDSDSKTEDTEVINLRLPL